MTSPVLALCLTCLFPVTLAQKTNMKFSSSVGQESSFMSVNSGDNLTLRCFYGRSIAPRLSWFKQTVGQKPRLLCSYYKWAGNTTTFYYEFKNNPRFTLDNNDGKNHLTIRDVHFSDSATYYCASFFHVLNISESITVIVKGSGLNIPALVHQSPSETIQPGGSETLNCTVHTGTCDGEHRVYWFRHSEESHPGLIYTHGGREDQCERKPEAQTHTCVYNLSMESLNASHAGTYYCAVASCGYIVFGNGTKLEFKDEMDCHILVYALSIALTFTSILSVFLALSMYKTNKRNSSLEFQARLSAPPTADAEGHRDADNLQYAALSFKQPNRSRSQRNTTMDECVYSSVNH